MIIYIGDRGTFDYRAGLGLPVIFSSTLGDAEKLIVTEYSDQAVRMIREAVLVNVPVLGILDGFQSIIKAFDGRCQEIECAEGKQEWAVIDTSVPIYKNLETTIKICRGKPIGILEAVMPPDLDCISRSKEGEIISVANLIAPQQHGNVYGINYYITSELTPDAAKTINNFLSL